MINPVAKARWVAETHGISGIPAMSLETIAKSEKIKCLFLDLPDDKWLAGMLLTKGEKRKIIVNTCLNNIGRNNFTLAHELGHYFLGHPPSYSKDGQSGFKCTSDDIKQTEKPREIEANQFAVELLMPEDTFRIDMAGAPIDFVLIDGLSKKYMVSKRACSNRILNLTQSPCVVIYTDGINITNITTSRAARGFINLKTLPQNTKAYSAVIESRWDRDFTPCDKSRWLCRTIPSEVVFECTHIHRESNTAMTIITW